MTWAGYTTRIAEMRNSHKNLAQETEWKRPPRISRHRWENNVKMDHEGTGCEGSDWIRLASDTNQWRTLVNTVMKLRVP
jgi:hypothetical protein